MKSKISYLPFNLLWCIGTFAASMIITWNLPEFIGYGISLMIYGIDVRAACAEDWLRDQISVLEAEQKKLQFQIKELEIGLPLK